MCDAVQFYTSDLDQKIREVSPEERKSFFESFTERSSIFSVNMKNEAPKA